MIVAAAPAAVVIVAYRTPSLDLRWIPDDEDVEVYVVHNDDHLVEQACGREGIRHQRPGRNLGFGAGVNLALAQIADDRRIVLCNPDIDATVEHWRALVDVQDDRIVAVPLDDATGVATSIVNRYPSPLAHLLTGWRLGRIIPRSSPLRKPLSRLLGRWGQEHAVSMGPSPVTSYPLATHWVCAGLISLPARALRQVGGFDPGYFLYFEDLDLSARLAAAVPGLEVEMATTTPATHLVGASSRGQARTTDRHHLSSCRRWARSQHGPGWLACRALLLPRAFLLAKR